MKIVSAYFKNWVGFYHGLGVTELRVDLTKTKHRFLLILGKNGSGKTTLEEGLTLFTDIYSASRDSNDFILTDENGNKDGYRELHILHKGITYISRVNWLTDKTKCFLAKIIDGKEVELNPAGNVRSYEECIKNELGLTKHREQLLFLGSGMRDIISKIPSERKNYISTFIPNTDKYLGLFKDTQKYYSKLKRDISVVTAEIEKLGTDRASIEERLNIASHRYTEKQEIINSHKNTLKNTEDLISMLSIKGVSIIDIFDTQKRIHEERVNKLRIENNEYNDLQAYFGFSNISIKDLEAKKMDARDELTRCKIAKDNASTRISELSSVASGLEFALNTKKAALETYRSENNPDIFIAENKTLNDKLSEITQAAYIIQSEIPELNTFENVLFDVNKATQYLIFVDGLMDRINYLDEKFDGVIIQAYINNTLNDLTTEYENEYLLIKNDLNTLESEIKILSESLTGSDDVYFTLLDIREKHGLCKSSNCPYQKFIATLDERYKNKVNFDAKFRGLNDNKTAKSTRIGELEGYINDIRDFYRKIADLSQYTNSFSELISLFPNVSNITDMQLLLKNKVFILPHARRYLEFAHLKEDWDKISIRLNEISSKIIKTSEYFEKIKEMEADINDAESKFSAVNSELQQFNNTISVFNDNVAKAEDRYIKLERLHSLRLSIVNMLKDHEKSKKSLKSLQDNYAYARCFSNSALKLRHKIEQVDIPELNSIDNERRNAEYSLMRWDEFTKNRNELEKSYNLLEILRKSWSPTTGIPLIFIEDFMNNLLEIANGYLRDIWNDTGFRIDSFGIDEKNFSIFVTRKETMLDKPKDASQCSGAERAMLSIVLSLALMKQLPDVTDAYNIVKFDEVDGSLDYSRQKVFMDILNGLLDGVGNEQTIMITHSNMLADGADVLIIGENGDEYAQRLLNGEYNIINLS